MSVSIGTPFTSWAKKVLLCGSGELGKEVVIELQRYGVEVIALDAYANAPAMQVADRSHIVSMLDADALRKVIELEKPDLVVPEVEAIATDVLAEFEREEKCTIIPTARATHLTMNREGIRRLAAEELGLSTPPYAFAETKEEFQEVVRDWPPLCGEANHELLREGQSTIRSEQDVKVAWEYAQEGEDRVKGKVIVEGFVEFDYEITQLTMRHSGGTSYCEPIGHLQVSGDYRESWQPQAMSELPWKKPASMPS